MAIAATYKGVLAEFRKKPADIQAYFPDFGKLCGKYSWDVSISYVFARIEGAKHWTIYCDLVKRHWTDAAITKKLVDRDRMSRGRFRELFNTVFGKPIPDPILKKLSSAEAVRDRFTHGKMFEPTQAQARQALIDAFEFAEEFSGFVQTISGIRPFGDLRGFKGRAEALPKETSRWVLRGIGIPAKAETVDED